MNSLFSYTVTKKKHLDKDKPDDIAVRTIYRKGQEMPNIVVSYVNRKKTITDKDIYKHIEMHLKSFSKNLAAMNMPRPSLKDEDELREEIFKLIKKFLK